MIIIQKKFSACVKVEHVTRIFSLLRLLLFKSILLLLDYFKISFKKIFPQESFSKILIVRRLFLIHLPTSPSPVQRKSSMWMCVCSPGR